MAFWLTEFVGGPFDGEQATLKRQPRAGEELALCPQMETAIEPSLVLTENLTRLAVYEWSGKPGRWVFRRYVTLE